jgi:ATP adenylyltransferase
MPAILWRRYVSSHMASSSMLGDNPLEQQSGTASGCRFCSQIATGASDRASWAVLAETDDVLAVPSVGPLVPGWLLVLPKRHVLSVAALGPSAVGPFLDQAKRIADCWQQVFGPLTWFEHGPSASRSAAGCGIDHAHLHLVPLAQLDLLDGARQLFPELIFREVSSLKDAEGSLALGRSYLYLRTQNARSWLASSRDIPSQAFRRVIADRQGRPSEFDWASFPRHDELQRTLRLSERFDFAA